MKIKENKKLIKLGKAIAKEHEKYPTHKILYPKTKNRTVIPSQRGIFSDMNASDKKDFSTSSK